MASLLPGLSLMLPSLLDIVNASISYVYLNIIIWPFPGQLYRQGHHRGRGNARHTAAYQRGE